VCRAQLRRGCSGYREWRDTCIERGGAERERGSREREGGGVREKERELGKDRCVELNYVGGVVGTESGEVPARTHTHTHTHTQRERERERVCERESSTK
jgi:hypothetical protein